MLLPTTGGVYATRTARRFIPQTTEEFDEACKKASSFASSFGDYYGFQVDKVNGNYYISTKGEGLYPNTYDKDRLQDFYYFMYAI